jgi:hypothetical protein
MGDFSWLLFQCIAVSLSRVLDDIPTLSNCLWWSSDQSCSLSSCLEEKFNLHSSQTNFSPPIVNFNYSSCLENLENPPDHNTTIWPSQLRSLCLHSQRLCLHRKYSLKRAKTFEIQINQSHDEKYKGPSTWQKCTLLHENNWAFNGRFQ